MSSPESCPHQRFHLIIYSSGHDKTTPSTPAAMSFRHIPPVTENTGESGSVAFSRGGTETRVLQVIH